MSTPHEHHADDARPDDGAPTDAVTDEVREDSAADAGPDGASTDPVEAEDGGATGPADVGARPDEPAVTHP